MKYIFGILILIVATTQSYGQDTLKPKITQTPSSELTENGSQVTFSCDFSTGINQCEWLKDDQVITDDSNYKTTNADGHCELSIQSFSNDNAGTYACRLPSQETEKDSDKITIPAKAMNAENDNSPAGRSGPLFDQFPELEYPQNTTAEKGTNVTLVCKFPRTAVKCFWEKDGIQYDISETNSNPTLPHFTGNKVYGDCSIILPSVEMKHDGLYKCGLPKSLEYAEDYVSNEIKLTILAMPSVPEMEYNGNIVRDGEIRVREEEAKIIVKCIVKDGNPAAELTWYKEDGTKIIDTNTTIIKNNDTGLFTTTNEIRVMKSEYNQRAVASCNATHESYTTPDHMMSIKVILILEGPVQEAAVKFTNTTEKTFKIKAGEEAFMNCTVHAEPQPQYEWQRKDGSSPDWVKFGEDQPTQVAKDSGHYRCGAKNEKNIGGKFKHSDEFLILEVEYPPEKTLQAGAIFGIVFGVVVILALVAWLVYYAYSREKWCFKRKTTTSTRQVPMAEIRRAAQESKPLRHDP